MAQPDSPPQLQILAGDGRSSSAPGGELAVVRGEALAAVGGEGPRLEVPARARAVVVCATLEALAALGAGEILGRLGAHAVVDLRVAPSFGSLGLDRSGFVEALAGRGVRYLHLRGLANGFTGDAWHAEHYRKRLAAQYRGNRDALARLRGLADEGLVLALVAEPSAMEQDLLGRALAQVAAGVEVEALTPG